MILSSSSSCIDKGIISKSDLFTAFLLHVSKNYRNFELIDNDLEEIHNRVKQTIVNKNTTQQYNDNENIDVFVKSVLEDVLTKIFLHAEMFSDSNKLYDVDKIKNTIDLLTLYNLYTEYVNYYSNDDLLALTIFYTVNSALLEIVKKCKCDDTIDLYEHISIDTFQVIELNILKTAREILRGIFNNELLQTILSDIRQNNTKLTKLIPIYKNKYIKIMHRNLQSYYFNNSNVLTYIIAVLEYFNKTVEILELLNLRVMFNLVHSSNNNNGNRYCFDTLVIDRKSLYSSIVTS